MSPNPTRHDRNRARLLAAASEIFLDRGYRASVDDIARRAGVVKQTLYHHFPSKDRLFQEVARGLSGGAFVTLEAGRGDLRADLMRFALTWRRRVLQDQGIALFRTLTAEVPRFPALARALYQGAAGETTQRLTQFLRRAMAQGLLRRDDPEFAADMLLGMLTGQDRVRRLYRVRTKAGSGERQRTTKIVDLFLRAYGPLCTPARGTQI